MNNLTISNTDITASFSTIGAELISLKTNDGNEYLWQGDPDHWSGQSPLLFPIIGGLPQDSYNLNSKTYLMKSHGFARKLEWSLKSKTENSIVFSLNSSPKTLEIYPFRFTVFLTYSVSNSTLKVEYTVKNLDEIDMPFQIGGHPAFNCPLENSNSSSLKLSDYKIVFEKRETVCRLMKKELLTGKTSPFLRDEDTIPLSHTLFDEGAIIFRGLTSRSACLQRKDEKGKKVKLLFPGFTHFGIWKKPGTDAPFICLEPWYGVDSTEGTSKEFIDKEGIITIRPDEIFHSQYFIELE